MNGWTMEIEVSRLGKMSIFSDAPGRLTIVRRRKKKKKTWKFITGIKEIIQEWEEREIDTSEKKKGLGTVKLVSWKRMNSESIKCRP